MKIAVLFPGYGSQHLGMGQNIIKQYPIAQELFQQASEHVGKDLAALCVTPTTIDACMGIGKDEICFSSEIEELNSIENAYIAIYVLSYALYRILEHHDITPDVVAGYTTGQYAATAAAGGVSFLQGLDLIQQYAKAYVDLLTTGMYAIVKVNGLTATQLPQFLDKQSAIAAYNSRTQHLVSGTKEGVELVKEKLIHDSRATLYHEQVGRGLNSPLMEPVVEQYRPSLQQVAFAHLTIPVISNKNGALITQGDQMKQELLDLITHPVHWELVIDRLSQVDTIIGIGATKNLLDLVIEQYPNKRCIELANAADIASLSKS